MLSQYKFLTVEILSKFENKTLDQAKSLLSYYVKIWKLLRVKRGMYVNPEVEFTRYELSNFLFPQSYISLENVLFENWCIKQFPAWSVTSVSNFSKTEDIYFWNISFRNFKIKNSNEEWIIINDFGIWMGCPERALLDLIYLRIFSKNFSFDDEIFLSKLNMDLVTQYSKYYWKRVEEFINKNVLWQKVLLLK